MMIFDSTQIPRVATGRVHQGQEYVLSDEHMEIGNKLRQGKLLGAKILRSILFGGRKQRVEDAAENVLQSLSGEDLGFEMAVED
jgi:hypothetical protein